MTTTRSERSEADWQGFFDRIRQIWTPVASQNQLIIPFCTPISFRPNALVIGTNHSNFAPGRVDEADRIAQCYATALATINTFTEHDHSFARGLKRACADVGITVSHSWLGTNRCAIQTDSSGIGPLKKHPKFPEAQRAMDEVLYQLIAVVAPVNLVLAGDYATELFFPDRKASIDALDAIDVGSSHQGCSTRVIAIPHPSMSYHWARASAKLKRDFIQN